MPYPLIIKDHEEAPPIPVNKPRVVESPLWRKIKDLEVGRSFDVNRAASWLRAMCSDLHKREADPAEKRAVKARRYKVKQLDRDNCRVWRLK